jgi:FkbM family methyltransferase
LRIISEEPLYWHINKIVRDEGLFRVFLETLLVYSKMRDTALRFWPKVLKKGMVVYDVGAHVGLYTIPAARIGCRVIAFEPNPVTFQALHRNIKTLRLRNVDAYQVGISACCRKSKFYISSTAARSSIYQDKAVTEYSHIKKEIEIQLQSLDNLKLPGPDVVKIDTEGNELQVIAGMINMIKRSHPGILVEMHDDNSQASVINILENEGYKFKQLENAGKALWFKYE